MQTKKLMKHQLILIAALMLAPVAGMAQSEWEAPAAKESKAELAKKAEMEAKRQAEEAKKAAKLAAKEAKEARRQEKAAAKAAGKAAAGDGQTTATAKAADTRTAANTAVRAALSPELPDYKYLVPGAVPQDKDGKVVFTLDLDLPGLTAGEVYDRTSAALDSIAAQPDNISGGIALVNKKEHSIAAQYTEWLTFKKNFISLDRTKFKYMMLAGCTDGHLHVTLERIIYSYEENRQTGMRISAEDWIADNVAINKKGTKLLAGSAKFRRATIDRKDDLFATITRLVKR